MALSLIVARASNGVIGNNNDLIWHLPDDLKFFKQKTSGHHIIMGRKTFESVGRPLPNRTNVIITGNPQFQAEGAVIMHSLEEALALAKEDDEPFVVGGAELYELAMPHVDCMYITEIHAEYEGDTRFPDFDKSQWDISDEQAHPADDKHAVPFTITTYKRRMAGFL